MEEEDTLQRRPNAQRPKLGWRAWEATVGYISAQHSPDAMLKVQAYHQEAASVPPEEGEAGQDATQAGEHLVIWSATLTWGHLSESVEKCASLHEALTGLWRTVDQNHIIFASETVAGRKPSAYRSDEWLDKPTDEMLTRLIRVTTMVFRADWRVIIIYQPVVTAESRVEARLLARQGTVQKAGRGATLRDACRTLYHNTVPLFSEYLYRPDAD